MRSLFQLDPATRKRLSRFRQFRRAYVSAWLLAIVCLLTLSADLLCNDKPLFVRFDGKSYFPFARYYAESVFIPDGKSTRPDYKALDASPLFLDNDRNFMVFAPIPFGPKETLTEESLYPEGRVVVTLLPIPRAGSVNIASDLTIVRSRAAAPFFASEEQEPTKGTPLTATWPVDSELKRAIEARFNNKAAPALRKTVTSRLPPYPKAELSLSAINTRSRPPSSVRLTLRTPEPKNQRHVIPLNADSEPSGSVPDIWTTLDPPDRQQIQEQAEICRTQAVDPLIITVADRRYRAVFDNGVTWPHPPIAGHALGIDSAGRDVLSRIIHGLRVSLLFSVLLVFSSMLIGISVGAIQGFYGGIVDITGQRIIEIWSAIPFLYVMILLGSIYGAHFWLLLVCYAIFNWIGISYYIRAEFLKLRHQPFVDAARVLGVRPRRIIFRHVLPNAITPIITFMPFYLVGAIASLAALDYLGFGLPALTPSLGQLLHQAQAHRSAWWLILYPSLALFIVMLLGVFVGEGVREALDPRPRTRME